MITLNDLGKNLKSHEIDFVFPKKDDTSVYLDLNLLYHSPEKRWNMIHSIIHHYFNYLLDDYRLNKINEEQLIDALKFHEVKLIALGYCKNGRNGKGGARERAIAIKESIFDNPEIKKIGIKELAKISIIIKNVGPDTLSDMVANFGMQYLIEYTQEQVKLHNLRTVITPVDYSIDIKTWNWVPIPKAELPYFEENGEAEPRILVPRHLVRKIPFFSPEGFYQNYLRHVLKHEEIDRVAAVNAIGKKPKVTFKQILNDLKSRFGQKIIAIRKIAKERPELVTEYAEKPELYKNEQRTRRAKDNVDWNAYIKEIEDFPKGKENALGYAKLLRKIITALYDGNLTSGTLEEHSEDSLFHYDISFGNGSKTFLFRMIKNQGIKAGILIVEAKNYDKTDVGNKEFNQSRAYTIVDGRELVFLISRDGIMNDDIMRARRHFLTQRCIILPISDDDIIWLIKNRKKDNTNFDSFLSERLKKILEA